MISRKNIAQKLIPSLKQQVQSIYDFSLKLEQIMPDFFKYVLIKEKSEEYCLSLLKSSIIQIEHKTTYVDKIAKITREDILFYSSTTKERLSFKLEVGEDQLALNSRLDDDDPVKGRPGLNLLVNTIVDDYVLGTHYENHSSYGLISLLDQTEKILKKKLDRLAKLQDENLAFYSEKFVKN